MTNTEGTKTTTLELQPGDRVAIGNGRIVRTVASVAPNGYLNRRNQPLYNVLWQEGSTPEWSGGNSGTGDYLWLVLS